MLKAAQDFNYKVALASGLKSLKAGRLRQAEEQFRYLTQKFPAADGGYRGLAKVLVELEDRPAALVVLRDGASALARNDAREAAIALLREALELDERDLGTHRRLVAALTLAGDEPAAVAEVERFVASLEAAGDRERARAELAYAAARLPAVVALAASRGIALPSSEREAEPAPVAEHLARDLDLVAEPAAAATATPERAAARLAPEAAPAEEPASADAAEERAMWLMARRDPAAARAALAAARLHLAEGRTSAASDLLLGLIASELAEHDAQVLLVEVVKALGRRDVARAKCALLAEALRLGGRGELAGEVDRLAQAV